MKSKTATDHAQRMKGVTLAVAAYFVFSLQDATVVWLVADNSVWEILFVRSVTAALLCLALGRGALMRRAMASSRKGPLLLRGAVILSAWLCYYSAARRLGLAELTTIYFAAPMMVTAMSVVLLRESVSWWRWAGTAVGFVGVIIACDPAGVGLSAAVGLVLLSAVLWAYSGILVRQISAHESTPTQMLFSNALFALACGVTLPWTWTQPGLGELALMAALGLIGAGAQYLIIESYRLAPASLVAPFEYSSLVWAFILTYVIWADLPRTAVFLGAAVIILSGLLVVFGEWRSGRAMATNPRV
ncbi:MAG: DMT family transporter [Dongiaceae bacterium]